jgi:hypothetical protein
VRATQTFTSGKRNDFKNLGIVQLQGSVPFRGYDWKGDPTGSIAPTPEFLLNSAKNQLFHRASFTGCFDFQFPIKRIRDVDRRPHAIIPPYLWLDVRNSKIKDQNDLPHPDFMGKEKNRLLAAAGRRGRSHGQWAIQFQRKFGAGRQNRGTVFGQPVGGG